MSADGDFLTGGRLIPLPYGDVHVYEMGPPTGPPILLIHGFLTSADTWRDIYRVLALDNRVILVDLPGSGRSPNPRAAQWSASRGADLLAQLCEKLGLRAPVVVGSQMGGSLAAWFAARHSDRVGRLVIMAAGALGEASANLTLYRLLANPLIGPLLARHFPREAFESRWRAAHGHSHPDDSALTSLYFEQLRSRGHVMARVGLGIRLSYGQSYEALADLIAGLRTPTLLIFGEADQLVPLSTGKRFKELMADARLVTLPGVGDFPQEEDPARVTQEILSFLERTKDAGVPSEGSH